MKYFRTKIESSLFLLAVCLHGFAATSHAEASTTNLEDHRRSILMSRVGRVVEARTAALLNCPRSNAETEMLHEVNRLRTESHDFSATGTKGLLALMHAYSLTTQVRGSNSTCAKNIALADQRLRKIDRRKFRAVGPLLRSLNPTSPLSPLEIVFMELDPWCASQVEPNFSGVRDTNPCFAGERPVLNALRDRANKKSLTFFEAADEADSFLAHLAQAVDRSDPVIHLESLFSPGTHPQLIISFMTYFYAAGTSELGWVDGFGEVFWRSVLDQGSSAQTALGQYLSWLNRKDRFAVLRKKLRSGGLTMQLRGEPLENWNHHEFISAFLACDYEFRGSRLEARAVPKSLGIMYEGRDFISHLRGGQSVRASGRNFMIDVRRHESGARFGRRTCR